MPLTRLALSYDDSQIVADQRGSAVLRDVDPFRIDAPHGFMALLCSDCDQIADKYEFLARICKRHCPTERVHLFALNSGGALLSPTSPTSMGDERKVLNRHIIMAMAMKGLRLLVSGCHAPCGMAYAEGLNLLDLEEHVFKGKLSLKKNFKDIVAEVEEHYKFRSSRELLVPILRSLEETQVACFPQIDYGAPKGKRTYSICGKDYWNYVERRNIL